MKSEFSLYEKVWGEPKKSASALEALPPTVNGSPEAEHKLFLSEEASHRVVTSSDGELYAWDDNALLSRLERVESRVFELQREIVQNRLQIETEISELSESIDRLRWSQLHEADTPDDIPSALKRLEARMVRLEKGVVRSLEYLESKIQLLGR